MTDINIGAGLAVLKHYVGAVGTDIGALYDPLPEIDYSRDALDDTNTKSTFERTKAGIRKAGPLTFKVKSDAAGLATIKSDYEAGTESVWSFIIPTSATGGQTEEIFFTAWVSSFKKAPSMKDETFINITLNVNELDVTEPV